MRASSQGQHVDDLRNGEDSRSVDEQLARKRRNTGSADEESIGGFWTLQFPWFTMY
jgi:hypothetical protein